MAGYTCNSSYAGGTGRRIMVGPRTPEKNVRPYLKISKAKLCWENHSNDGMPA
jgi:hypothetical protein